MSNTCEHNIPKRQTTADAQNRYLRNTLGSHGCAGIFRLATDGVTASLPARQAMVEVEQLAEFDLFQPQECVALNSFSSTCSRSASNLGSLNAFYLDLDVYKVPGLTVEAALGTLSEYEYGHGIPHPSYVIRSGQGVYLIWLIDPCAATEVRKAQWFAITEALYERTRMFGCDPKCRDIVRVLRVPGSINLKPGVTAEVLIAEDNSHLRYSLAEMADFLGVELGAVRQSRMFDRERQPYDKGTETANARSNKPFNPRAGRRQASNRRISLLRAQDIEKTLLMQGRGVVGHREVALFYYRHFMELSGRNPNDALAKTLLLNRRLPEPLREKEVVSATKSRDGAFYWPSNDTLIEALSITAEIESGLATILMPATRAQRRRQRSGRVMSRSEETALKRAKIAELRGAGMTIAEVCRAMSFSKTTYYNLTLGRRGAPKATKALVSYLVLSRVLSAITGAAHPVAQAVLKKPHEIKSPFRRVNLSSVNYMHKTTHNGQEAPLPSGGGGRKGRGPPLYTILRPV